jgi:signal recognition particle receptor subunit beta
VTVVNYASKEIAAKIVFFGPEGGGKTSNLLFIYKQLQPSLRSELISLNAEGERTLVFDFLSLDLGATDEFRTRLALYALSGRLASRTSHKVLFQGADGIVFVADSSQARMPENTQALQHLKEILAGYQLDLGAIPWVLQANKRDAPDAASIEDLRAALNAPDVPVVEANAAEGTGVFATLKEIGGVVLQRLTA